MLGTILTTLAIVGIFSAGFFAGKHDADAEGSYRSGYYSGYRDCLRKVHYESLGAADSEFYNKYSEIV